MSTPASPPKPGSSSTTRYILLGILAILLAAMAHDYLVAQPATNKASQELEEFALKKIGEGVNREGEKVKDNQFVRSDDVQKILGRKPSLVKSFDNAQGGHVVEYYCYRPWLPVPEISKHYVAVVYWGKDNPRYMSHHINMVPPPDAYPDYRGDGPNGPPPEGGPPAEGAAAGLAPAGAAPMGTKGSSELSGNPSMDGGAGAPKGGKGQKGGKQRPAEEGKSEDKPASEEPSTEAKPSEDKPAEEKPAEAPAEDKPAEQPASEEKPAATEEKPAEAAPAESTEAKPEEAK
ncbi:MAG: hypothetical protein U0894_05965 [Pirellulales bacterium]